MKCLIKSEEVDEVVAFQALGISSYMIELIVPVEAGHAIC
jgi:hypothetical protein|tara:strand:- start:88 stop:207 length:120 start_codon:yes stop_codon:yes gene_type:complete